MAKIIDIPYGTYLADVVDLIITAEYVDLFLSSKIVTLPSKSSHPFLPRCKTVVERMRSDGIIPEQDVIINISE